MRKGELEHWPRMFGLTSSARLKVLVEHMRSLVLKTLKSWWFIVVQNRIRFGTFTRMKHLSSVLKLDLVVALEF